MLQPQPAWILPPWWVLLHPHAQLRWRHWQPPLPCPGDLAGLTALRPSLPLSAPLRVKQKCTRLQVEAATSSSSCVACLSTSYSCQLIVCYLSLWMSPSQVASLQGLRVGAHSTMSCAVLKLCWPPALCKGQGLAGRSGVQHGGACCCLRCWWRVAFWITITITTIIIVPG